ncbi:copper resistance protein CopD [Helicobacter cappadocius]|uniref:Copper resistance protein CopD n=1 Tax=Helicobacter cappadocius TaxID=3063998 RepID=A0AA90PK84_9HELI|nr:MULTISPECIES: copper resistance protein CopD [unclassified Helicobacter]MDO7253945.1 copper resistance protein CopD [Helicobacter sp. faydin-H75]MDP2538689.1 copper resistance protein CopD [Helicobacter sp. faydin-H76]
MQTIYPFILIIHLSCAIIFLGYLFFDIAIFPNVKKMFGEEIYFKASKAISQKGSKIMPLCVLGLLLTGGMMMSNYINSAQGWFDTNLQKLLVIKIFFALVIIMMILISLTYAFILKKPSPLRNIIHPLALTLGFIIVILAKAMFFV